MVDAKSLGRWGKRELEANASIFSIIIMAAEWVGSTLWDRSATLRSHPQGYALPQGRNAFEKHWIKYFLTDVHCESPRQHTHALRRSQVRTEENKGRWGEQAGNGGEPHGLFRDISPIIASDFSMAVWAPRWVGGLLGALLWFCAAARVCTECGVERGRNPSM